MRAAPVFRFLVAGGFVILASGGCAAARPVPQEPIPVAFVSAQPRVRWDVYANDKVICTTPCKQNLDPGQPLSLRIRGDSGWMPLVVPDLYPAAREGSVRLEASPGFASLPVVITYGVGIMFGLLGVPMGGAIMAVGCPKSPSDGSCEFGAGLLTTGALVMTGSYVLAWLAQPKAKVTPIRPVAAPEGQDLPGGSYQEP